MDVLTAAALPSLPVWSSYVAVTVGGIAGASYAARRGFDVTGVLGLAIASGLGGLLLRDVLLQKGTPVVLVDPRYLLSASVAALVGFLFAGYISRIGPFLLTLDALAMGLFVSLGAMAAFYYDLGVMAAFFLAVVTAVGGSVLRDLLSGEPPAVLRPGIFSGIAALFGAVVFVLLYELGVATLWNQVTTIICVAALRLLAVWRRWESPSSADMMDKLEDFLLRAREPLSSLPIAPAARPIAPGEWSSPRSEPPAPDSTRAEDDDGSPRASGTDGEPTNAGGSP